MKSKIFLIFSALLVGFLYVGPQILVSWHLQKTDRQFAMNFDTYRDELIYFSRAREVYDGHFPASDLYFDEQPPTVQNPLPSLILASFLGVYGGNPILAYLSAEFIFAPISFLLFYFLGLQIFNRSAIWAFFLAYVGTLTPIALRILNFHGA